MSSTRKPIRPKRVETDASARASSLSSTSWPKLIASCPVDQLCQLASKSTHSFSKYRVHQFSNRRNNEPTKWQWQVENVTPPSASLSWRRHNIAVKAIGYVHKSNMKRTCGKLCFSPKWRYLRGLFLRTANETKFRIETAAVSEKLQFSSGDV